MHRRDDDMPNSGDDYAKQSLVRRRLASLRLVEPLMLATLYRPGLGSDVTHEDIIRTQSTLLFRTIELTDRILKRLSEQPDTRPYNRYQVAREIVSLVALQWRSGSELTAEDLASLAEHAVAGGMQLMRDLTEQPYEAGEDAAERLTSAISASARIMLSIRDRAALGHDAIELSRKMTSHLAKLVAEQASKMRLQNHVPAIKALIRVFSDYYPALWDGEISAATQLFSELRGDPERFAAEVQRLRVWPLEAYFDRVEQAADLCIDMAETMQQLLDEQVEPSASSLNP
jgi:hypothetical protein